MKTTEKPADAPAPEAAAEEETKPAAEETKVYCRIKADRLRVGRMWHPRGVVIHISTAAAEALKKDGLVETVGI